MANNRTFVIQIDGMEKAYDDLEKLGEKISDTFKNTNGALTSFSSIVSSSSAVLKLFGIESRTLTETTEKLAAITKTLNTLQALHTQIVEKDSIIMKAAALSKKLYTIATQGSSVALKGFKTALIATGLGAFLVLLGYLIANFDDIKKQIAGAVGGMGKFEGIIRKVEPVIAGLGNVFVQFLLIPVKQIINAITGLIKIIDIFDKQGLDGFKDAFNEITSTVKNGVKIQIDSLDILKNYSEASDKSKVLSAKEATKKILSMNSNIMDNHIKNMEAQNGASWKYSKEAIQVYQTYFDSRLAMYEKDSEEYKQIQREKWSFDAEAKQQKASSAQTIKKNPEEYLKDLKNIQQETDAILSETEEKQIEHLKNLADNINSPDAIVFIKEAAQKELAIQSKKHQQERESLAEHQQEMQNKYEGNSERLLEINEAFGIKLSALDEKQAKERFNLKDNQAKELNDIEDMVSSNLIKKEIEGYDKLIAAQEKFIGEKKNKIEEANKDILERNGLGLINVGKTRENYQKAIEADTAYLNDLAINHLAKGELLKKELALTTANSEEEKDIKAKMLAENKKYRDETKSVNERIAENTKNSTGTQKKYFEELHAKMSEVWGKINEGLSSAFEITNSIMQQQMDEAKAKLEDTTKRYDAIVEKRKESQNQLKSLEEEASSASGGRAIVIQEQIARQMEANEELSIQEKDLAKEKDELEKEIAQKEKQLKKNELGQKLIEGVANTALAVTKALAAGPLIGQILAGIAAAAGAVQTGIIARQLSKLEDGGLLRGKRHTQGGMRIEGTNIEVEGEEFVVNRISTRKNLGLINYINNQRKELTPNDLNVYFGRNSHDNSPQQHTIKHMYEIGGQLTNLEVIDSATAPDNNKILDAISRINFQPVVSVVDISTAQNNITQVKDIAGI